MAEKKRLQFLHRLRLLDSPSEAAYDDLTLLARQVSGATAAAISLVDRERVWFKARNAIDPSEIPRRGSLPDAALGGTEPLVVQDASRDRRFQEDALVKAGFRFYAGIPIRLGDDHAVATLDIRDRRVRKITDGDRECLLALGRQLAALLERRLALESAEQSAQRIAAIVDSSADAIIGLDLDGVVISWNLSAEQMFGYAAEEMIGRTLAALVPKDLVDEQQRNLASIRRGERVARYETYRLRKDGARRAVSIALSPIRGGDSNVIGVAKIARDITEQKAILDEKNRLHLSEQAATQASKMKSEFLAQMSHEIRTPINGVIGMTGLLLDTPLSPEQREYAEAVGRSADSLLTIINDILDFSKIEAGKLEFEEAEFDLALMIQDTLRSLNVLADKKKISLSAVLPANLPGAVMGDPGRLRQVLNNLLSNAIKFTSRGEVKLVVQTEGDPGADPANLRFEVHDTGIGIPPEALSRMFLAFSQADASTARRFGGTGLGLSISKHLVERMHGRIGVESQLGRGTMFWFTVPLKRVSAQKAQQLKRRIDEQVLKIESDKPLRILVAEDNVVNQKIAVALLAKMGLRADAVANGYEVLDALREIPYDLILMDCQMPECDGYEATRLIRNSKTMPVVSLPIIAMTANALKGDRERCLEAGMNDYLSKPVRADELAAMIRKWLLPKRDRAA